MPIYCPLAGLADSKPGKIVSGRFGVGQSVAVNHVLLYVSTVLLIDVCDAQTPHQFRHSFLGAFAIVQKYAVVLEVLAC